MFHKGTTLELYTLMSRILQGTSNIIQVDTSLLLQRLLQFAFTLTCPHGLNTTCWILKASSTCLQGFFSWLHGFKASSLGFMDSILKQSQGLFTWLHGFKCSLLGFVASKLLHLLSWLQYSNNLPFSLPHHHHHCYIPVITTTSSSSLPL